MADDKVYTPQVIEDTPFPGGEQESQSDSSSSSSQTYTPKTIKDNPVRRPVIATETIGQALNTKSKKILGDFQFTESGAISIGKYTNGVSGDVKISPNGIVAKNSSGNTTFALDGDTGNATFSGTIQAEDVTIIDDRGLVSLSSFSSFSTTNSSISTTSSNYEELSGSSITINLIRDTNVIIFVNCSMYLVESLGNTGHANCNVFIDNTEQAPGMIIHSGNNQARSSSLQLIKTLLAGRHTIDLRAQFSTIFGGTPTFYVNGAQLTVLTLGS